MTVTGGPGSVAGLGVPRRGVYMRQPHEAAAPASYTVNVAPTLHEVRPMARRHAALPANNPAHLLPST